MFVTVGSAEWNELLKRLKNNDATLIQLDLSYNDIGDSGTQDFSEAFKGNHILTQLHLGSNKIGNNGAKAFSETLKGNRTLTQLKLDRNEIGVRGAKDFSEVLKENRTLTLLDFSSNKIGDSGAKAFSEALKENHTLTQLNLRGNQIKDSGAQAFSEALKENRIPTLFRLSNNQIRGRGAQDFSEALKVNRTLIQLDLSLNQIGDRGAQAFSEALKKNHTLTQLDLGYNQIEDSNTINSINNFLARNNDLIRKRRNQFIQTMIVLACDSVKTTSHSLWRLLPKPIMLYVISFIHFHPWESIDKSPQQVSDCAAYIFDNTSTLEASLKKAVKTKRPFQIVEKKFDTTTNKFPFFFTPLPAQLATTSKDEKTYPSPYEKQNQ